MGDREKHKGKCTGMPAGSDDARSGALERQLRKACADGRREDAQQLLSQVCASSKNESGSTPLHEAAWSGHLEICALLLEKGAEVCRDNAIYALKLEASLAGRNKTAPAAKHICLEFMAETLPCTRRAKGLTGRWLTLSVLLLIGLGHPTFFSLGQADPLRSGIIVFVSWNMEPKPLTPARQNNVIATAAPPLATHAAESSRKTVLVVSDASGRTASGLLAGVLAQFSISDGIEIQTATEVTTRERLQEVIEAMKDRGGNVLVLATLVDSTLSGWARTFCTDYNLQFVEVMGPLLDRMGGFLEQRSRGEPGASLNERAIKRIMNKDFFGMVEAVKYSQRHIGGLNAQDWHEADIILVGPSRCGKGPVAHQLAMRGFKFFVQWKSSTTSSRVARRRGLAEPDIDKWLETLEGTEGGGCGYRRYLTESLDWFKARCYRNPLRDFPPSYDLPKPGADVEKLEFLPQETWPKGGDSTSIRPAAATAPAPAAAAQDGGTRLVPHRGASAARQRRAVRAAKAARQGALGALKRSLKAENEEEQRCHWWSLEAVAAAAAAARGVREALEEDVAVALKGRQASDLALSLALAGCDDPEIFDAWFKCQTQPLCHYQSANLAQIAEKELLARQRSLVSVQQTVERLATAGQDFPGLFKAGEAALKRLGGLVEFGRPLLWLFRHATRQGRRCIPPTSSKVHEAVLRLSQSGKPLVIDLGCGFGASSLGLAQHGFAVLAVDASAHCIRYATALARRWQLPESGAGFVQCGAEEALAAAQSADIDVKWILINFPTPFAVQSDRAGLSHLPQSFESSDFMANQKMLEDARQCLLARGPDGHLLVQSNVEDVAVTLRGMAEANRWEAVTDGSLGPERQELQAMPLPRSGSPVANSTLLPRMASEPLALAGHWLARTETEAYYTGESLPIHRAAALNISPNDILPEELTSLQPYQVALITVEEERLVKLRQNRVADMKIRKMSMLIEDDYADVARVRQDLQLTKELKHLNPQWPDAVDMTYLSPEECASLLIRQVKEGKKAAALRLPSTK
eukprot:s912_g9.t1